MSDGLLFIKLLNLLDKDAIDMRTINKYMPNMNKICIRDNINQALTAASGIINTIGVQDQAFTNKSETIILGVLTQIARQLAEDGINLKNCPEILELKYEDEDLADFRRLKPEEILIRWVNHHLKNAGQSKRISNLGKDIADSTAMTHVLNQLDKKCNLAPLNEDNLIKRGDMMIANSKKLGCSDVLEGEDLVKGNPKVNALFVAEVFNTKNGLTYDGSEADDDLDEEGSA